MARFGRKLAVLVGLLFMCLATPASAQMGLMNDSVRASLAARWDQSTRSPYATEDAVCVQYVSGKLKSGETYYLVYGFVEPLVSSRSSYGIAFSCPASEGKLASLHTHPPASCVTDTACAFGGYDAFQCAPSPDDARSLAKTGRPFGIVQCDRNAHVFFFRPEPEKPSKLPYIFVGGLAAGALVIHVFNLSGDPGGYKDSWTSEVMTPDKAVHAGAAWALTNIGVDMKMNPWLAAAAVTAAGVAFEVTQGHVSSYDIGANTLGAFAAAAWRTWRK